MDARLPNTRTIWLITAGLFAFATLVSLFSGSPILAILLLLITVGCVVVSRRAPRDDGRSSDEAESTDEDEDDDESADDKPRKDDKRLWSEKRYDEDEESVED